MPIYIYMPIYFGVSPAASHVLVTSQGVAIQGDFIKDVGPLAARSIQGGDIEPLEADRLLADLWNSLWSLENHWKMLV